MGTCVTIENTGVAPQSRRPRRVPAVMPEGTEGPSFGSGFVLSQGDIAPDVLTIPGLGCARRQCSVMELGTVRWR